jgi:hypothetical protein
MGTFKIRNSGKLFWFCANIKLNTITDILNLTGTLTLPVLSRLYIINHSKEWTNGTLLVNDLTGMFQMTGASTNGIGVF